MSIFCKHRWEEKERFKCEGKDLNLERATLSAAKELVAMCLPTTTILYQCKLCNKPKKLEIKN